jgi:intein/homing endonuclease
MTIITKLSATGFKSFAKKTDLLFGNTFNCVIGPNGSGKCLDYDSIVQLSDGSLTKIGDLVNEGLKRDKIKIDDGYLSFPQDLEVLSLDIDTLKGIPRNVKSLVKRTAPKYMLRIKTRSGKEIKATEYHPLFVLDNGKVRSIKAEELNEGAKIAVPREIKTKIKEKYFFELLDLIKAEENIYVPFNQKYKDIICKLKKNKTWKCFSDEMNISKNIFKGIMDKQSVNFAYLIKILRKYNLKNKEIVDLIPYVKSKNSKIKYRVPWKNSGEFSRVLGYLIAEGRLPPSSSQIWFTNGNEEIVADYKNLVDNMFGVNSSVNEYKPNCWDVLVYSRPIRKILEKFGMVVGGTGDKNLTNLFLSHSYDEELAEFSMAIPSFLLFVETSITLSPTYPSPE